MIDSNLASQIAALRQQVSQATVPSGLLSWFGATAFPGGGASAPSITQQQWEGLYLQLQQAAIAPGLITPLAAVKAMTAAFRPDGPLPIAIANYSLSVAKPDVIASVQQAAVAGTALAAAPSSLADAIAPAHAFIAAGLLHDQFGFDLPVYRGRVVTLTLDERFYFTNLLAALPDAIEIDPGDGKGARKASFGDRITVVYPRTSNRADVTIRCTFGAETRTAHFSLPIGGPVAAPFPDDTWQLTGLPTFNTGKGYVYRAPGHATLVNPVIIAEGFPGGYPYDYLYDMMNQQGLLKAMHAAGYDVVLLGFDNGMDQMQDNAQVVTAAIRKAMSLAPQAPLVVGGVSMGGLVTRYALAYMESRGQRHNTRLYFSIDSPHRGAYTNLGAQWLVQYFGSASALASTFGMLLSSQANQQFVTTWVDNGVATESPLRKQWTTALAAVGDFPKLPRRIAASCGHDRGGTTAPHQKILEWTGSPFVSATLYSTPAGGPPQVIGEGYNYLAPGDASATLVAASDVCWESVPGGHNIYNTHAALVAQSMGCGTVTNLMPLGCSVPTVSALNLDQDPTAPIPATPPEQCGFDAYICSDENQRHLVITEKVSTWLLDQIGTPEKQSLPAVTVTNNGFDPASFNAHDPAYSADPYPTYANFRKYAPVSWVDLYRSYWVFGYEDVRRVMSDTATFTKHNPRGEAPSAPPFGVLSSMPNGIFTADPPLHTHLRGIVEPLFHNSIADATALAAAAARPMLVNAKSSRRIELMSAFAYPLPSSVLLTVLGFPKQDWPGLIQWSLGVLNGHDLTAPVSSQAMGGTCSMAMMAYFQALAKGCPHSAGQPRLFQQMLDQGSRQGLTAEQIQTTSLNVTIAGYLSTSFLIGTGMYNLLRNPDQLALLRSDYAKYHKGAIREMLRYDAPAQVVDRVVAVDEVELGGVKLHLGDSVTAVIGSANRDESVFKDPDAFDITRTETSEVASFGDGIHYCLGAPLVWQVAPVAFQTLLQEFPVMKLAGTPQWQTDPYLRSVANLALEIG